MPTPDMAHATRDPNTPVTRPNVWGSENIPAPTIDPTTMAVRVQRLNFWLDGAVDMMQASNGSGDFSSLDAFAQHGLQLGLGFGCERTVNHRSTMLGDTGKHFFPCPFPNQ